MKTLHLLGFCFVISIFISGCVANTVGITIDVAPLPQVETDSFVEDLFYSVEQRFGFKLNPYATRQNYRILEKDFEDLGLLFVGSQIKNSRIEIWIGGSPDSLESEIVEAIKEHILSILKDNGFEEIKVGSFSNPFA